MKSMMRSWNQVVVVGLVAFTALPAVAGEVSRKANTIEVYYQVPGNRAPAPISAPQAIELEYGTARTDCRITTLSNVTYPCVMNSWGEPELTYKTLASLTLELIGVRISSYPAILDMLDDFTSGRASGRAALVDRVSMDPQYSDKLELHLLSVWSPINSFR